MQIAFCSRFVVADQPAIADRFGFERGSKSEQQNKNEVRRHRRQPSRRVRAVSTNPISTRLSASSVSADRRPPPIAAARVLQVHGDARALVDVHSGALSAQVSNRAPRSHTTPPPLFRCLLPGEEAADASYWLPKPDARLSLKTCDAAAHKNWPYCSYTQCELANGSRCGRGYVYDRSEIAYSALQRWDIVCEWGVLKAVVQSRWAAGG